ncbi:MAG: transcriptional repressor LexA, partial [Armatimonadetes bacterium]|nr:transcriptional repressor LexA [Armatimonadota bacterium]
RRQAILQFIEQAIRERGYPPTVREIGAAVGLRSTSTVHFHLRMLQEQGLLEREPLLTRALRPVRTAQELKQRPVRYVPVVGRVAAGQPVLAEENVDELLPLPEDFLTGPETFLLRVRGDSMIGDGIHDGDLVVVERRDNADSGDIVVALLEDEATVKRLIRHPDFFELRPSNDNFESIIVRDVRILGKVVGLLRRLA